MARTFKPERKQRVKSVVNRELPFPAVVTRVTLDEARVASDEVASEVKALLVRVTGLLACEGPSDPRDWDQRRLRVFAGRLRAERQYEDAAAVERYADARVRWANAIELCNRIRYAPPPVPSPWVQQQQRSHERERNAEGLDTSARWAGNDLTPDSPPAWHWTVPPWIDGPESA